MKEIIIATNNNGKLKEFNKILNKFDIKCLGLKDINFTDEIVEDKETFKENALIKAKSLYEFCGKPVIADDSGICVDALNNQPGVYSARYMNLETFDEKMNYILNRIDKNRKAFFNCTICLYNGKEEYYFEGILNGTISAKQLGSNGFGYDPIFIPNDFNQTLAQLNDDIKNSISHRKQAIDKLMEFLNETNIF